jgi:hypothetical protein
MVAALTVLDASSISTASCSTVSPCTSAQPIRSRASISAALKSLVRRTNTPWLSDHLCWGSVDPPPPTTFTHAYTFEAARVTADKIREAQDFLESLSLSRNVSSYAEFHVSQMTSGSSQEVVEQADWHSPRRQQHLRLVAEPQPDLACHRPSPPSASPRSTSPATPGSRSTSSTLTTILSLIPFGRSTRAPSSAAAPPPRCSNGTTPSPPSTRCMPKP